MLFRQLFETDTSTYTYLIADEESGDALLIDPVLEQVDRDLVYLRELGLTLRYVLDTHVHADHITGAATLRARTGAQIVVGSRGPKCADIHARHLDVVRVGSVSVTVLETPGHTDDSVCYLANGKLCTGDTILIHRTGRSDFQNGDPGLLYDSITNVLFALPDETAIYPCHDYDGRTASSIAEEKRLSTVASRTRSEFIAFQKATVKDPPRKMAFAVPANLKCGDTTGLEIPRS